MGAATSRIGVVATMSTLGYPPFLLARLASTVDHISGGRFGWNIVTSAENSAAQNFGLEKLPPRELRYAMAHEYMELAYQLFDSWEPDAVVRDRETATYADFRKVRPIHFKGKFYRCRGPLNTVRSPQGRPTLVQAGGSPSGRDFAAKHADSVVCVMQGTANMRAYRDDIRARARAHGRDPDDVKVLFLVAPVLAETDEEARARQAARRRTTPISSSRTWRSSPPSRTSTSRNTRSTQPLPERLTTNGEQGSLDSFQQWGSNKTLRELVVEASGGIVSCIELVGTPESVADRMGQVMEEVGGDGFLLTTPSLSVNRRHIIEVVDGLVPALQRRGLVRTEYTHATLRDNLRAF